VKVTEINDEIAKQIDLRKLKQVLLLEFAHYLKTYEKDGIEIEVDGEILNISDALASSPKEVDFSARNPTDNNSYQFKLAIYHWKDK